MNHVVTNLGHSARERLKNLSRESGRIPDYLFQRYAYERSFYRLGESRYRSRFVLKGRRCFPFASEDYNTPIHWSATRPRRGTFPRAESINHRSFQPLSLSEQ